MVYYAIPKQDTLKTNHRLYYDVGVTLNAMRGLFWAFGVFNHNPLVSILLQYLCKFIV